MKRLLLISALTLASAGVMGKDYNADGKTFGQGQLDSFTQGVSDKNAKDAPFYSTNPPQKASYGAASLFDVGSGRINSCKTAGPTGNKIADQECEAVNYLAKRPENRVTFELDASDPAIVAGRNHANNAKGIVDELTGGQACTTKTTTTPAEKSIETCSEYLPIEEKTCTMGQKVSVDADSNFQCDVTYKAYETKTCDKRLTVTCKAGDGCGLGGVAGTPNGDMKVVAEKQADGTYQIEFGVNSNNYWDGPKGQGTVYDRKMTLQIDDATRVQLFELHKVRYDDWMLVKVNGTVVWVGPKSGDRLEQDFSYEAVHEKADKITCKEYEDEWGCSQYSHRSEGEDVYVNLPGVYDTCEETSTQWKCGPRWRIRYGANSYADRAEYGTSSETLGLNLKSYLKTGNNEIFVRTIVGGEGEAYLLFNSQIACPSVCTDAWDDQCEDLQARTN